MKQANQKLDEAIATEGASKFDIESVDDSALHIEMVRSPFSPAFLCRGASILILFLYLQNLGWVSDSSNDDESDSEEGPIVRTNPLLKRKPKIEDVTMMK